MPITDLPYQLPETVESIQLNLAKAYDTHKNLVSEYLVHVFSPNPALKIAVTNRCNLSCNYCYYKPDKLSEKNSDMSMQTVDRIFKFYPFPASVFILGGEPFLNPNAIIRILDCCPSKVIISTNGHIKNKETEKIFKTIIQRQQSKRETIFQVSSEDGGNTNERGGSNLSFLLEELPKLPDNICKVKFTFTEPDVKNISKITSLYWNLGINVHYDFADGGFGTGLHADMSNESWKIVYEFMLTKLYESFYSWCRNKDNIYLIDRTRVLVNQIFPSVLSILRSGYPQLISCSVFKNSLFIDPSENIYPCHRWRHNKSFYWGKLGEKNHHNIVQLSENEWKICRKHCEFCRWRGVCGGICPAVTHEYGPQVLIGRCKFTGALRDAVLSFLTDEKIMYNQYIDEYLSHVKRKVNNVEHI
jgi:radical SAM protein with 4Fe4S-binding SPASM domain